MLIKNIYMRVGVNVFNVVINFIPFIFIAKIFGVDVLGKVAYYYSFVCIFSLFTDLGITTAYTKFLASEDDPRDVTAYLFLKIILIFLYVVIFCVVYYLISCDLWHGDKLTRLFFTGFDLNDTKGLLKTDKLLLLTLFVVAISGQLSQIFTATFRGKRDFKYLSKLETAASVLLCIYNLLICFVCPNIYLLAANKTILPIVLIIGGVIYFRRHNILVYFKPRRCDIKRNICYAAPIAFVSVSGRLTSDISHLMIGRFVGLTELGFYQIASRCYSVIDRLIKPVTSTLFSEIVHRITNDVSFFHKKFRNLVHMMNYFAGILTLLLLYTSTWVISSFFGAENQRSAFILNFFALSILARMFWRPYTQVLYAIEKHKYFLYLQPLSLLVTIGCYYFIIPFRLGDFHLGASALPLTEFIVWLFPAGILKVWLLKREYGDIYLHEIMLKIWLPLCVILAASYVIGFPVLLLPVALIIYCLVEFYLGIMTRDRLSEMLKPIRLQGGKYPVDR